MKKPLSVLALIALLFAGCASSITGLVYRPLNAPPDSVANFPATADTAGQTAPPGFGKVYVFWTGRGPSEFQPLAFNLNQYLFGWVAQKECFSFLIPAGNKVEISTLAGTLPNGDHLSRQSVEIKSAQSYYFNIHVGFRNNLLNVLPEQEATALLKRGTAVKTFPFPLEWDQFFKESQKPVAERPPNIVMERDKGCYVRLVRP